MAIKILGNVLAQTKSSIFLDMANYMHKRNILHSLAQKIVISALPMNKIVTHEMCFALLICAN